MKKIFVIYQQNFRELKEENGSIGWVLAFHDFYDAYTELMENYTLGYKTLKSESNPQVISVQTVIDALENNNEFVVTFDVYNKKPDTDHKYNIVVKTVMVPDNFESNLYLTYVAYINVAATECGDFKECPEIKGANEAIAWFAGRVKTALKNDYLSPEAYANDEDKFIVYDVLANNNNSLGDRIVDGENTMSYTFRDGHSASDDYQIVCFRCEIQ